MILDGYCFQSDGAGGKWLASCLLLLCHQVKKKMSVEDFLKNNRGINDGQDLPAEFLRALYDRIVHDEIQVRLT